MKYLDKFRDSKLVEGLVKKIRDITLERHNFMEVCGTHTVTILRSGIKELLRDEINLDLFIKWIYPFWKKIPPCSSHRIR